MMDDFTTKQRMNALVVRVGELEEIVGWLASAIKPEALNFPEGEQPELPATVHDFTDADIAELAKLKIRVTP